MIIQLISCDVSLTPSRSHCFAFMNVRLVQCSSGGKKLTKDAYALYLNCTHLYLTGIVIK